MGTEIERKFLVSARDNIFHIIGAYDLVGSQIVQGYLTRPTDLTTVRVRVADGIGWLTVKGETIGASRPEFEYQIPLEDANKMLEMTPYKIEKTRYRYLFDEHVFEIDCFHGVYEGLVVVEVEVESEDTVISFPSWISDEVTGDPEYYNSRMSLMAATY